MALLQRFLRLGRKPLLTGLDIGSHSIKLVRLKARQDGYQLVNFGVMPLPARAIVDHTILDEGSVVTAIRNLIGSVVGGLRGAQRQPARLLAAISQSLPEQIWLDAIRDTSGRLEITGRSFDNDNIAAFMENLGAVPGAPLSRLALVDQLDMRAAGRRTQCLATTFRYLGEEEAGAGPAAVPASFNYDPQGRRDPMEPLVKEAPPPAVPKRVEREPDAAREPLERFDLAALRLVAIVRGGFGSKALVKAPDGKGYYVTVGARMGMHGGRVSEIRDQALVIEERYVTPENELISKPLTLTLRRRDGEGG